MPPNSRVKALNALRRARIFLSVCLLLSSVGCGTKREERDRRASSRGFDYYVLALSWAPAFCAHETANRASRECGVGREVGFVVHGLWPERDAVPALENCAPVTSVPADIIERMLSLMPDSGMIQHEWRAHGSCSGLPVEEYFATVQRASESVRIPDFYQHLHRALQTSVSEIERRFAAVNHLHGASSIRVQCRGGEVREVRICLTKELQPRSCSRSVRDCRAGQLFMRPIE
jgi:ribonuclease T2